LSASTRATYSTTEVDVSDFDDIAAAEKLAAEFIETPLERSASLMRTAGEIRHIKDNLSAGRDFLENHNFRKEDYVTLTKLLWQVSVALGHTSSVVDTFSRIKSFNLSPDGKLGGMGYNKSVTDMRAELTNALNTLSGVQDTLFDEVNAPHWREIKDNLPKKQKEQVEEIIEDVEEIKEDPEGYAEDEFIEEIVNEGS